MFIKEVLEPVIANIQKFADRNAFLIDNKFYTYSQFGDVISKIRDAISMVNHKNPIIGLVINDDIETYASIIALWLEGCAYVPLNPGWPIERCLDIINQVKLDLIIDSSPITRYNDLNVINPINLLYSRPNYQIRENIDDDETAYILFTSGSTGKPKGVQITRGNIAAFVDSMDKIGLNISEVDCCLQPFELSFDFSVSSYLIPLIKGACIFTIPKKATKYIYIAALLADYKLTVLQMVPSMIRNLLPYMDELELKSVRYNILCGEALTGKIIREWHRGNPSMVSYNMYGPTENTVFCTYYMISEDNVENPLAGNDIVSIGKSFKNCGLLLLDENDKIITSRNVEGELCLCGKQLTPGYWENPRENASQFLEIEDVRYYRTGDICYLGSNNNLMFVSRKDYQVKINGFRVELGEIENRYTELSGGRFCIAIPFADFNGNTELAIVVEGEEYDLKEHKIALSKLLPPYEIPSKWLFMKSLPVNQNGKIDRKKIKEHFNL
ncbi:MAG: AMP-binding protein [Bacteroidaceae bacterium]|nr:AMP-binding protein [Bacteroidaceae bacterium]